MGVSKATVLSILVLAAILIGLPLAILTYEANRTGRSLADYLKGILGNEGDISTDYSAVHGTTIQFLEGTPIGDPVGKTTPWISHLSIVDLDGNGLMDVVLGDAKLNQIRWIRQQPAGTYREEPIGSLVIAPAHVTPSDVDQDGDLDLLVAEMGMIFPNNDKIGAVIIFENTGKERFSHRVLAENIARVTDVEPGDLDDDGDIDLAVGQFGYDDGEIRWMENKGNWHFESHLLLNRSGTIHTPVADMDGDADLDIVAIVSQEWEEIYVFENDGEANFKPTVIFDSNNEDFGSSGISVLDLDLDGDLDVLYTNGDAFDYIPPEPRPWHGVQWLENRGALEFKYHRIGDVPGAFSAKAVDVDRDSDLDILVVSEFNDWSNPDAQSMVWFENDGRMRFVLRDLLTAPTHLLVLDYGDMDGDGWIDFVTGGMHAYPPFDRMSRITLWRNNWLGRRVIE
ncbi:MAG: FG-GAP repeat domain-containing protein [Acidobacteriota bacterium]